MNILFHKTYTTDDEINAVIESIRSGWLTMGPKTIEFEQKFNEYIDFLLPLLEKDKSILIYSMWKEYVNPKSKHANKRYLDFIDKFPKMSKIHTSGHASAKTLTKICKIVNPSKAIIPIHSEHSADIYNLDIPDSLKEKIIIAQPVQF